MSDNKTLQLERLKDLLTQLESKEQKLRNDSINDDKQKADFDEIEQLIQQVRGDIEEVYQLVEAQGNQLKPEEIEKRLLITHEKIEGLEKDIQLFDKLTPDIKKHLKEVDFIKNILTEISFLASPEKATPNSVEYNQQIQRLNAVQKVLESYSIVEEPLSLEEIQAAVQTVEDNIEAYKAENKLAEYKEDLISTSKRIAKKVTKQLSKSIENNRPQLERVLARLTEIQERLQKEQEQNLRAEHQEDLFVDIDNDLNDLQKEVEGHQKSETLFENKESLLSIVESTRSKMNTLNNSITKNDETVAVEYDRLQVHLQNLKTTIEKSKAVIESQAPIAIDEIEENLVKISTAILELEKKINTAKEKDTLFQEKATLTPIIATIENQFVAVSPILETDNSSLIAEYQSLSKQLATLTDILSTSPELPKDFIAEYKRIDSDLETLQKEFELVRKNNTANPSFKKRATAVKNDTFKNLNKMIINYSDDIENICQEKIKSLNTRTNDLLEDIDGYEKYNNHLDNLEKNAEKLLEKHGGPANLHEWIEKQKETLEQESNGYISTMNEGIIIINDIQKQFDLSRTKYDSEIKILEKEYYDIANEVVYTTISVKKEQRASKYIGLKKEKNKAYLLVLSNDLNKAIEAQKKINAVNHFESKVSSDWANLYDNCKVFADSDKEYSDSFKSLYEDLNKVGSEAISSYSAAQEKTNNLDSIITKLQETQKREIEYINSDIRDTYGQFKMIIPDEINDNIKNQTKKFYFLVDATVYLPTLDNDTIRRTPERAIAIHEITLKTGEKRPIFIEETITIKKSGLLDNVEFNFKTKDNESSAIDLLVYWNVKFKGETFNITASKSKSDSSGNEYTLGHSKTTEDNTHTDTTFEAGGKFAGIGANATGTWHKELNESEVNSSENKKIQGEEKALGAESSVTIENKDLSVSGSLSYTFRQDYGTYISLANPDVSASDSTKNIYDLTITISKRMPK